MSKKWLECRKNKCCMFDADYRQQKKQIAALVKLIKLSYRNWLEDPDVAWGELGEQLCDGLCNSIGDKEFQEWLKKLKGAAG